MASHVFYIAAARRSDGVVVSSHECAMKVEVSAITAMLGEGNVQALRPGQHGSLRSEQNSNEWRITADDAGTFFVVVVDAGYPRGAAINLLDEFQAQFRSKVGAKVATAQEGGLTKTTEKIAKQLCQKYDDLESVDQLSAVRAKIEDVTLVMQGNVDLALASCVKLENIEARAEELSEQAHLFHNNATALRKKMWWKNCKTRFILGLIIAIVITCIGLVIAQQTGAFKKDD